MELTVLISNGRDDLGVLTPTHADLASVAYDNDQREE